MIKELYKIGDTVCLNAESCEVFGERSLVTSIGSMKGTILKIKKYAGWPPDYLIKFDTVIDGIADSMWLDERLITLWKDEADEDINPENIDMLIWG